MIVDMIVKVNSPLPYEVCSHPPGTPDHRIDQQLIYDQCKWCFKNLNSQEWHQVMWLGENTRFRFLHEKDAVLFALRWR